MLKFLNLPTECVVKVMNNIDPYTAGLSFDKVNRFFHNVYKMHYNYDVSIYNLKHDIFGFKHTLIKICPKKNNKECIINILKKYQDNEIINNFFFNN